MKAKCRIAGRQLLPYDGDWVVSAFLCVGRFYLSYSRLRFCGFCLVDIATGGRPDLSIIAPDRWAARMPGTGPLRRSSTPVRKKAIVDKSHIAAGRLRSPRSVFLALFRMSFTGRVCCSFLEDFRPEKSFAELDRKLSRCQLPGYWRIFPLLSDVA